MQEREKTSKEKPPLPKATTGTQYAGRVERGCCSCLFVFFSFVCIPVRGESDIEIHNRLSDFFGGKFRAGILLGRWGGRGWRRVGGWERRRIGGSRGRRCVFVCVMHCETRWAEGGKLLYESALQLCLSHSCYCLWVAGNGRRGCLRAPLFLGAEKKEQSNNQISAIITQPKKKVARMNREQRNGTKNRKQKRKECKIRQRTQETCESAAWMYISSVLSLL